MYHLKLALADTISVKDYSGRLKSSRVLVESYQQFAYHACQVLYYFLHGGSNYKIMCVVENNPYTCTYLSMLLYSH